MTTPAFAALVTALAVVACVVVGVAYVKIRKWDKENDE